MATKTVYVPAYVWPQELLGSDIELHIVNLDGSRRKQNINISPDGNNIHVEDLDIWGLVVWKPEWAGGDMVITFFTISPEPTVMNFFASTFITSYKSFQYLPAQLRGNMLEIINAQMGGIR